MKLFTKYLPFATITVVAAVLGAVVSANAAPATRHSSNTVIHFHAVPISVNFSKAGGTQKNPAGVRVLQAAKLVSAGHVIGRAEAVVSVINKSWSLTTISAWFKGLGLVELQGAHGPKSPHVSVIIGGTGVFAGATGWTTGDNGQITLTYS